MWQDHLHPELCPMQNRRLVLAPRLAGADEMRHLARQLPPRLASEGMHGLLDLARIGGR